MTAGQGDADDTVMTGPPVRRPVAAAAPIDTEDTRIRVTELPDDETRVRNAPAVDDATVIVRGGAAVHDTVLRAPVGDLDRTVIIGRGGEDATVVTGSVPGVALPPVGVRPTPGRLSGGRVAEVPSGAKERYTVRDESAARPEVVRAVIPAPVSNQRQTRDTRGVQVEVGRRRRTSGALTIVLVVTVTIVALAAVGGVIALLLTL